ncbi:uncharacterized protein LOC119673451 [Teleopsis dalmanni]|uniref:uncharacterized protein LOC119668793 n=1 Tax=Teleopsis dalmanni TaxID=139649 RepID=UPI0018CD9561|nr:uncharacterized protein LOC119668793 [Teleopsis dalmanni]XP_037940658.1 uncharacterized protein LOC119673451 [Teleopsis dalmanni]
MNESDMSKSIEDTDHEKQVYLVTNKIMDKVISTKPRKIIYSDDETPQTSDSNSEVKIISKFYRDRKETENVKYSSCFPEHWFCGPDNNYDPKNSHQEDKRKDLALEAFKRKIHYLGVKHYPVRCPVDACNEAFDPDELLSHIFYKHTTDNVIRRYGINEIHNNQTAKMHFKDTDLQPTKAVCIGCVLYVSAVKKSIIIPPDLPFCNANTFLHQKYAKYKNHAPIMIMASLTTWAALLLSKPLKVKCKADKVQDPSLLLTVIWLVGTKINKPFNVCLTLFSENMLNSKSAILKVRPIYEAQKPCHFLRHHINYMLLSKGELDLLSNNGRTNIKIEFTPSEEVE